MSPGILLQHTRNQLDSLAHLVDQARIEGPLPLDAEDYRNLVNLVLEFPGDYQRALDSELRRAYAERQQNLELLQRLRAELVQLADRYVATVRVVEADPVFRRLAPQYSFLRDQPARLTQAMTSLQEQRARLDTEWPVGSPEEQARIMAAVAQGQFKPIEEAFAEMKDISLEELSRRMEEHKRRRKEYGWE